MSRVKAENAGERLNSFAKVIAGWRKVLQASAALSGWRYLNRQEKVITFFDLET